MCFARKPRAVLGWFTSWKSLGCGIVSRRFFLSRIRSAHFSCAERMRECVDARQRCSLQAKSNLKVRTRRPRHGLHLPFPVIYLCYLIATIYGIHRDCQYYLLYLSCYRPIAASCCINQASPTCMPSCAHGPAQHFLSRPCRGVRIENRRMNQTTEQDTPSARATVTQCDVGDEASCNACPRSRLGQMTEPVCPGAYLDA